MGMAGQLPDDGPEGWAKSEVDPTGIVTLFDRLRGRPGGQKRWNQFFVYFALGWFNRRNRAALL